MGAVFAELFDFVVFEDAEGFAGEVGAVDVGGVEDVAEFVAGEAVEVGVVGVEFGAEVGTAFWVPDEGVAVVAHVLGEGLQVPGVVCEFENARGDEVDVGTAVCFWGNYRQLIHKKIIQVGTANLIFNCIINHKRIEICRQTCN